ncbi:MAG: substrate-binding periplasmic protein [Magnetospiraceae bacterium]
MRIDPLSYSGQYRHLGFVFLAFLFVMISAIPPRAVALTFDEIQEKGEIIVAVYRDFPPFSYRDANGTLVGIDVDIAAQIANSLDVRLTVFELTADETVQDDLRNAVWKGHYLGGLVADVMLHVPYDRAFSLQNNQVFFFGAYLEEAIHLTWNPDTVGAKPTLAVFRFEKIGVELDTLADFALTSFNGGMIRENVLHYRTIEEAAQAMRAGEVQAILATRSQLDHAFHADAVKPPVGPVLLSGVAKPKWLIGAAVKHTYRQLGYAVGDILAAMVNDGTMEQIFAKHGITYRPPPDSLLGATAQ